jgi:hypothetical protein
MTTFCRFFETFSFLPPLDDAAISKQVDYIIRQGWIPCLEFADADHAYVKNDSTIRFGGSAPCNYYDNRRVVHLHEAFVFAGFPAPILAAASLAHDGASLSAALSLVEDPVHLIASFRP